MPTEKQLKYAAIEAGELSVEIPLVDIEAAWNQTAYAGRVRSELVEVTEDDLRFLKAEDLANEQDIFEALCAQMPFLREIVTMTKTETGVTA
jgi:hypothetical protein